VDRVVRLLLRGVKIFFCGFHIKFCSDDLRFKCKHFEWILTGIPMSSTVRRGTVVRDRAEWMRPRDDEILEVMRDEGNMTPQALEEFDVAAANYARDRLSILTQYGLVERLSRGLYRLTDEGRAYLNEDLDAATLDSTE